MTDPCANKEMAELTIDDIDRIEAYRRANRITSLQQFCSFVARDSRELNAIKSAIQRATLYDSTRVHAELKERIETQLRRHICTATEKGERDEKRQRSRSRRKK